MKNIWLFSLWLLIAACSAQDKNENRFAHKIDSLLQTKTIRPFNGVILISQNDSVIYSKSYGYADFEKKITLVESNQFVIGSISKQITAVLVLQALEEGKLRLEDHIGEFLPDLKQTWKDSVTVHHLLNHTHGIQKIDAPLLFHAGSDFSYSNLGFSLLGSILEKVSQKLYSELVGALFSDAGMLGSVHPLKNRPEKLAQGMVRNVNEQIVPGNLIFSDFEVPAGELVSTRNDLRLWNDKLHRGGLLKKDSYDIMTKPTVTQNHSLFGNVGYALGIRVSNEDNLMEIGHTGYVPGYVSMNFYYPETNTSLIVLENLDWNADNIMKTFYFELEIRSILRNSTMLKKN